jgi:hypothetical protein
MISRKNAQALYDLGLKMREAQRQYFKIRDKAALRVSRHYERLFDAALKACAEKNFQNSLFPKGDDHASR